MELNKPMDLIQDHDSDSSLIDSDIGGGGGGGNISLGALSPGQGSALSSGSDPVNITSLSSTPRHSPVSDPTAEFLFNYQQLSRSGIGGNGTLPTGLASFGSFPFTGATPMLLSQQFFKPINYLQNMNLLRPLNLAMNSIDMISTLGGATPTTTTAMSMSGGATSIETNSSSGGGGGSSAGGVSNFVGTTTSSMVGTATNSATAAAVLPTITTTKVDSTLRSVSASKSSGSTSSGHTRRSSPSQMCLVCSDISSGKHYGIYACNGCSGFFKRSVRRRLIYRCQAGTGSCIIDKQHRNQCQACRLTKCLTMGMNKDAVQNERQPRNTATIRPEQLMSDSNRDRMLRDGLASTVLREAYKEAYNGMFAEITNFGQGNNGTTERVAASTNETNNENGKDVLQMMKKLEGKGNRDAQSDTRILFSPTGMLANYIKQSEQQQQQQQQQQSAGIGEGGGGGGVGAVPKEAIYDFSRRILYATMKWIKDQPTFATISLRDQVILIEEAWADIFLLIAIQWSLPTTEKGSFFAPINNAHNEHGAELRTLHDVFERFRSLQLSSIEFDSLKALALFKPEARGLKEVAKIEQIQDQHQLALMQHVRGQHSANSIRFGKLLLMLLSLKIIPADKIATIYFKKISGKSPMENVLYEMFKC